MFPTTPEQRTSTLLKHTKKTETQSFQTFSNSSSGAGSTEPRRAPKQAPGSPGLTRHSDVLLTPTGPGRAAEGW